VGKAVLLTAILVATGFASVGCTRLEVMRYRTAKNLEAIRHRDIEMDARLIADGDWSKPDHLRFYCGVMVVAVVMKWEAIDGARGIPSGTVIHVTVPCPADLERSSPKRLRVGSTHRLILWANYIPRGWFPHDIYRDEPGTRYWLRQRAESGDVSPCSCGARHDSSSRSRTVQILWRTIASWLTAINIDTRNTKEVEPGGGSTKPSVIWRGMATSH